MNKVISYSMIAAALLVAVTGVGFLIWNTDNAQSKPQPSQVSGVEYVNDQYGLKVDLPGDWQGYSVAQENWQGSVTSGNAAVQGPMIAITSPQGQQAPIMVFTPPQWNQVKQGILIVSENQAAPSQLTANNQYVFAIPSGSGYANPVGVETFPPTTPPVTPPWPVDHTPMPTQTSGSVQVIALSPLQGSVGSQVTIEGSGFTADNTVLMDGGVAGYDVHLSSFTNGRQTIVFTVPASLSAYCQTGQACPLWARQVTPGVYAVSVQNANGASNSIDFTVTGTASGTVRHVGDKEFNFVIQKINQDSVDGLWYIEYPLASGNPVARTIHIGDTVGYECSGRWATLSAVNYAAQTVTFAEHIQQPSKYGCPICLASNTMIDTPSGPKNVTTIKAGDIVWSVNASGQKVAEPVMAVSRTPVPSDHLVVHVILKDGRQVWASLNHPLITKKPIASLKAGDAYDGSVVQSAQIVSYWDAYTYDILPAGATGEYWANGIVLKSTLSK